MFNFASKFQSEGKKLFVHQSIIDSKEDLGIDPTRNQNLKSCKTVRIWQS